MDHLMIDEYLNNLNETWSFKLNNNNNNNSYSNEIILCLNCTNSFNLTLLPNVITDDNNNLSIHKNINYQYNNNNIDNDTILSFNINNNNNNINNNNNNYNNNNNNYYNMIINTAETINDYLMFYYIPALVLTGSIGNLLSVLVFFKTKLKKLSSSYYLAALAVSDTCFLFGVLIQWFNNFDINLYNRDCLCQLFTFFTSLCSFLSVWFVVAFTVERFIAVMYPLKRQTMCTVRRAKIVLLGLTITGAVHCMPYIYFASPVYEPATNSTVCDFKSEYKDFMTILNYVDTVVVFVVPFTTIAVLNTFTGCTVWKFATVRRTMTLTQKKKASIVAKTQFTTASSTFRRASSSSIRNHLTTTNCSHSNGKNGIIYSSKKSDRKKITNSSQIKVTKMLLIVSTVFVCLNLPSYIMRLRAFLEPKPSKTELIIQYLFWFLFLTNFGINFVLYCVSGQNFRRAVISMFRKASSSTTQRDVTQVTVSEYMRANSSGTVTSRRRILNHNGTWADEQELKHIGSIKLK